MSTSTTIRLATRGSRLALWQTDRIAELIRAVNPGIDIEKVIVSTRPDRIQDQSLEALGGDKGLFVREVEQAILDGTADGAVHSLKDVPVEETTAGLSLVAFPERADPRDALLTRFGVKLADLPVGSVVATGAPRRQAQLLAMRPDLKVCGVRGNVETRIGKLDAGEFDAIIMAAAGLERLDLQNRISHYFSVEEFIPAPGQGIVVVQAAVDSRWNDMWTAIDNPAVRKQAECEREFSRLIGADCHTAAGCYLGGVGLESEFRAVVCAKDGSRCLRHNEKYGTKDNLRVVQAAVGYLKAQGSDTLL